jgi:hypothetical protein
MAYVGHGLRGAGPAAYGTAAYGTAAYGTAAYEGHGTVAVVVLVEPSA